MKMENRQLFLKYALPCAGTLVKRGNLSQERLNEWINKLAAGSAEPGAENTFKVAMAFCTLMAKDAREKTISENTVRRYFLHEHDKVVDKRAEEMGDFDPDDCRAYAGKVVGGEGEYAMVETQRGIRKCRTDFCKAERGSIVAVHWDFVVETVDLDTAKALFRQKERYFPSAKKIFDDL